MKKTGITAKKHEQLQKNINVKSPAFLGLSFINSQVYDALIISTIALITVIYFKVYISRKQQRFNPKDRISSILQGNYTLKIESKHLTIKYVSVHNYIQRNRKTEGKKRRADKKGREDAEREGDLTLTLCNFE